MKVLCFIALLVIVMPVPAMSQSPQMLSPSDFKGSSSCQECHGEIYSQWTTSMHSRAFQDPIYLTFLRKVSEKTQGRMDRFCVSCHAPLASVTNTGPEKIYAGFVQSRLAAESVSCEFCHTILGREVERTKLSLGAFLFPHLGQTKILYGRHEDAKTDAHATQVSKFLLSSELCGTCHRFSHPATGLSIQDTYAEWKQGPYAAEGKRCQDCHMPSYTGKAADKGPERPELHAHVFKGGHTEMIEKAATVGVRANWSDSSRRNRLKVNVVVTNSGAGHSIPTGIPGIREMWVEITVFSGNETVAVERRPFGVKLLDAKKEDALPWDAVSVGKDTRIAPKQSREENIEFNVSNPSGVRVEAKVLERLVSEFAARSVGIPPSPALLMAHASTSVP